MREQRHHRHNCLPRARLLQLENSMKETEDTSANDILTRLSVIIDSADGAAAGIDPAEEVDAYKTLGADLEVVLVDEDAHHPTIPVSFLTKKMHPSLSSNPWIIG